MTVWTNQHCVGRQEASLRGRYEVLHGQVLAVSTYEVLKQLKNITSARQKNFPFCQNTCYHVFYRFVEKKWFLQIWSHTRFCTDNDDISYETPSEAWPAFLIGRWVPGQSSWSLHCRCMSSIRPVDTFNRSATASGVFSTTNYRWLAFMLFTNDWHAYCFFEESYILGRNIYEGICTKTHTYDIFKNWLRFYKVTESLKVGTFLRHGVSLETLIGWLFNKLIVLLNAARCRPQASSVRHTGRNESRSP